VLPGIPALEKYAAVLDLLAVLIWVLPGMYLTAFLSMILYGFRRERMVLAVGFGGIVVFTALSGIGLELVGESALFWAFFLTYAGQTVGLGAAYLGLRHGKDRAARGTEIVVEPS
jgi:CDP-diglyceride synthetase